MARPITVISIEGDRVDAVVAQQSRDGVRVRRVARERMSGASLAETLRRMVLPRGPAVLAVPRASMVFKVLDVPEGLVTSGEWLSMARLQLARHLPMPEADAAVDAVLVRSGGEPRVVAGAVALDLIEPVREAMRSSGLRLEGAEPTGGGAAALAPHSEDACVVVAPGSRATEITLARGGVPLFARSIDAATGIGDPELDELDRVSARVAVEVKRTLIGARSAGLEADARVVHVLGDDELSDRIATACEVELASRASVLSGAIAWPDEVPADARRELAPLAGVVARRTSGLDAIDFVRPHEAPDAGARRRQLTLLALLALITVVGGSYVLGSVHLSKLRARLESARANATESVDQLVQFRARDARVGHAEQWVRAGEDWLPYVETIADAVRATPGTALAELRADARATITFERGPNIYPGTWTRETSTTFRISGGTTDAAGTRALRRELLDGEAFHVLTQGPDSGNAFTFDLVANARETEGEPR